MFSWDAIRELAEFMYPLKGCRFVKRGLNLDSEFYHVSESPDGRSLKQIFDEIEQPGSWIALYNIEKHPDYAKLLNSIVGPLSDLFKDQEGDFFNVGGFMFISAPPAYTPYHMDRENNFWLQLKGQKRLGLFERSDRTILSETQIEDFIVNRSLDSIALTDEIAAKAEYFDVKAGEGVYFPSTTPHMTETTSGWEKPGDGVSVSLGVPFYTQQTRYIAQLCQYNKVARRLHLPLSKLDTPRGKESIKAALGRYVALTKKNYRHYNPPPGSY